MAANRETPTGSRMARSWLYQQGNDRVLARYGSIQADLKRIVELKGLDGTLSSEQRMTVSPRAASNRQGPCRSGSAHQAWYR